jgi:spore germination protein YaaH
MFFRVFSPVIGFFSLLICLAFLLFTSCQSGPSLGTNDNGNTDINTADDFETEEEINDYSPLFKSLPVSSFAEIWGYVVAGREAELQADFPLSDVGYFGAEIDSYGKLTDVPVRKKLFFYSGRVHLVVVCNSRSLTHFALESESRTRRALVADLLEASQPYDGLQIDFELVPARDGDSFRSFLAELREGLRGKTLTIALPARTRTLPNDVYDYQKILPVVDRILIMAYDEHWSGSAPGPVASMNWCRTVADYALGVIGPEKLIMGIPFYGRSWGNINGNRAFYHSGIERIKRENGITEVRREESIPTFTYEVPLQITVYYDDDLSLSLRMEMYRSQGVRSVGFWSVGQESPGVWNILELSLTPPD